MGSFSNECGMDRFRPFRQCSPQQVAGSLEGDEIDANWHLIVCHTMAARGSSPPGTDDLRAAHRTGS